MNFYLSGRSAPFSRPLIPNYLFFLSSSDFLRERHPHSFSHKPPSNITLLQKHKTQAHVFRTPKFNDNMAPPPSQRKADKQPAPSVASSSKGTRGADSCTVPPHIKEKMMQKLVQSQQQHQQYSHHQQYGFPGSASDGSFGPQPSIYSSPSNEFHPYSMPQSYTGQPLFQPGSLLAMMSDPMPQMPGSAVLRQSWPASARPALRLNTSKSHEVDPYETGMSSHFRYRSIDTVLEDDSIELVPTAPSAASTTQSYHGQRIVTPTINKAGQLPYPPSASSRSLPIVQGPTPNATATDQFLPRDSIVTTPSSLKPHVAQNSNTKSSLKSPLSNSSLRPKKRVTFDDQPPRRRSSSVQSFVTAFSSLHGSIDDRRDYGYLSNYSETGDLSITNPDPCQGENEECICRDCYVKRHERRMACARVEERLKTMSETCEGLCLGTTNHNRIRAVHGNLDGLKCAIGSMSHPSPYLSYATVVADEEAAFQSFMYGLQALEAVVDSESRIAKTREENAPVEEAKSVGLQRLVRWPSTPKLNGAAAVVFKRPQWLKRANSLPAKFSKDE